MMPTTVDLALVLGIILAGGGFVWYVLTRIGKAASDSRDVDWMKKQAKQTAADRETQKRINEQEKKREEEFLKAMGGEASVRDFFGTDAVKLRRDRNKPGPGA